MPCRLKEKKKKEIFFSGKIGGGEGGKGEDKKGSTGPGHGSLSRHLSRRAPERSYRAARRINLSEISTPVSRY